LKTVIKTKKLKSIMTIVGENLIEGSSGADSTIKARKKRKKRKEEGKLRKQQKIEESSGDRPRNETKTNEISQYSSTTTTTTYYYYC
jgi:hypothetical protein